MMAGGDDGLPWRWAGQQWLWLPVEIKNGGTPLIGTRLALLHGGGHTNTNSAHATPSPLGALCGSIDTFTDSLVKGMTIVWPGMVGEQRGGNGRGRNGGSVSPLSIAVFRFFEVRSLLFSRQITKRRETAGGRGPVGPPISSHQILSADKNWEI